MEILSWIIVIEIAIADIWMIWGAWNRDKGGKDDES